jgi:hypothetical protein
MAPWVVLSKNCLQRRCDLVQSLDVIMPFYVQSLTSLIASTGAHVPRPHVGKSITSSSRVQSEGRTVGFQMF